MTAPRETAQARLDAGDTMKDGSLLMQPYSLFDRPAFLAALLIDVIELASVDLVTFHHLSLAFELDSLVKLLPCCQRMLSHAFAYWLTFPLHSGHELSGMVPPSNKQTPARAAIPTRGSTGRRRASLPFAGPGVFDSA